MKETNHKVRSYLHKHGPAICTTIGVFSMLAGTVLAVKETPKAVKKIKEADIPEDASKKERFVSTVKATWKGYIPSALCEVGGMGLIFGSARTYGRRYANMSNMFYISEAAYQNLQNKMEEKLTKKQVADIKDSIAEDKVKENPPQSNTIIITDKGNHLFFDSMTGQYFRSSFEEVHRVVNEINARLNTEYYVQMNELIVSLGESPCKTFECLIWSVGEQVEVRETNTTINGEEVTVLTYNIGNFDN